MQIFQDVTSIPASFRHNEFRRLAMRERGNTSNLPVLFPITKILTGEQGICFQKVHKIFCYSWNEIESTRFIDVPKFTGVFPLLVKIKSRTCVMRAGGRKFTFDLSSRYPDYENGKILESILLRQLPVATVKKKYFRNPYLWIGFFIGLYFLVRWLSHEFS